MSNFSRPLFHAERRWQAILREHRRFGAWRITTRPSTYASLWIMTRIPKAPCAIHHRHDRCHAKTGGKSLGSRGPD